MRKNVEPKNETLYLLSEVITPSKQKESVWMKNLTALILTTQVTWRTRVLEPLVEQDAQTQAWHEAQDLKKRGRPNKNDVPPPAASVSLVIYTGLTARAQILAV